MFCIFAILSSLRLRIGFIGSRSIAGKTYRSFETTSLSDIILQRNDEELLTTYEIDKICYFLRVLFC